MHLGAHDPVVRLGVLDECGIDAQVIFPSTIGLGGQDLGMVDDLALCRLAVEIYNDGMAEIQADSGNRLLPLPLMPAWDVDDLRQRGEAGRRPWGARREHDLGPPGSRCAGPGQPGLGPLLGGMLGAASPGALPHRCKRQTAMTFFGQYPWGSHAENTKLAIGGTLLFIGNARVVTNVILVGRSSTGTPTSKSSPSRAVSGGSPSSSRRSTTRCRRTRRRELAELGKLPSEYFRTNLYATFWFENNRNKLPDLIEAVGEDNILFETDFPHPTCLYPNPLQSVEAKMETLSPEARRKILGENARTLYRL